MLHEVFALAAESRGCALALVRGLLSVLAGKPAFLLSQDTGSDTLGLQEPQHVAR